MISVVIPTYNRAHFISRAIHSALNQTYQEFEIIVVDDGSTDNTEQVVKKFSDKRIVYIRHEVNKGVSAARNTGIKISRGEFIAYLDNDDEWLPDKLEKQITKFNALSDNFAIVYSGAYNVLNKTEEIVSEVTPYLRGKIYTIFLKGCIFDPTTAMIRKSCFEKSGLFDESLSSCHDWDMWIRIAKHYEIDFVPDILMKHYVHKDQVSTDLSLMIQNREMMIKKYQSELYKYPVSFSEHLKRLAILCCLSGNFKKGRNCFLNSIKHSPFQYKLYANYILALLAPVYYAGIMRKRYRRGPIPWYY